MGHGISTLDFGVGRTARVAVVREPIGPSGPAGPVGLTAALAGIGLIGPRPVVVVAGGADGLDSDQSALLSPLLADVLLPIIARTGAVVIDGGTDSGVMRLMGRLRAAAPHPFALLGVAAEGTVTLPAGGTVMSPGQPGGGANLEPHHSHFLLVPGDEWGDEAPWMAGAATALAGSAPSVTLLLNGGPITFADAAHSLAEGRPVLVLAGTGRVADRIAAAAGGDHSDGAAAGLAGSPGVHVVPAGDAAEVRQKLSSLL